MEYQDIILQESQNGRFYTKTPFKRKLFPILNEAAKLEYLRMSAENNLCAYELIPDEQGTDWVWEIWGYSLWDTKDESQPMMTDSPFERNTNKIIVEKAKGDVLIMGLGMGLIVYPIMKNKNVTSVLIIEKYQEVIDLIMPQMDFNDKVTVKPGDAFEFTTQDKFDTIWIDIWTTLDEAQDMAQANDTWKRDVLAQDLSAYLRDGGYCDYWKPIWQ